MRAILFCITFAGFIIMVASPCNSMVDILTFDETVKKADLIFLGQVIDKQCRYGPKGKMIFTDVYFQVLDHIHKKNGYMPVTESEIILTLAGGTIPGEKTVQVSGVPSFEVGSTYLVFTYMNGKPYFSPIIGVNQGLFRIITDEESGVRYPLTYGRRGIIDIKEEKIVLTPPVSRIRSGLVEAIPPKHPVKYLDVPPRPAQWMDATKVKASVHKLKDESPKKVKTLKEFIGEIKKRTKQTKGG